MSHRVPVSVDDSQDPLARMRVAQLADELRPDCFKDAKLIVADRVTKEIAGQLYRRGKVVRPPSKLPPPSGAKSQPEGSIERLACERRHKPKRLFEIP